MAERYRIGHWHIWLGECCGSHCAKAGSESEYQAREYPEYHERTETTLEWMNAPGGSDEEEAEASKLRFESPKKLLARMVEDGKLTQEQAAALIEKFLDEHPDLREGIDVTEEFEHARPIPVVIPQKEKVEQ